MRANSIASRSGTFTSPTAAEAAGLVITEIHADPARGPAGDANADGVRVDVQLSEEWDDALSALLTVTPPRAQTLEE